jgi:hypothetical protein
MRALPLTLVLLAAAAAGCGEDPAAATPDGGVVGEGELELGSAAADGSGFIDVVDGADVELVAGAQGGFHVWTALRLRGAAGHLHLSREARRQRDGALVLHALPQTIEVPDGGDWWQPDGAIPSFMCPSPVGLKVFDEAIELSASIEDDDGNVVAEGSLVVVPRCPTGDLEGFCHDICAG